MAYKKKYKDPTLLEILGGAEFWRPVWLPYKKLVCSRCFRVLPRKRFDRKSNLRVEPICLEFRDNDKQCNDPNTGESDQNNGTAPGGPA
jgi:hypothetical protein